MLHKELIVPLHLAELVVWFVETVTPLTEESGWSVNVNGGGAGVVQVDVRRMSKEEIKDGERRNETREIRNFRLKSPPKPRGIGAHKT